MSVFCSDNIEFCQAITFLKQIRVASLEPVLILLRNVN